MTDQQQYPTREQIAEALRGVYDEAAEVDDNARRVPFDIDYTAADAVLALFPQSTPSAEPNLTERLAELQQPVNGHRPHCLSNQPGDGPCNCDIVEPPSIADMAPGTQFGYPTRWEVGERGGMTGRVIVHRIGTGDTHYLDDLDPSTIRDVTPPPPVEPGWEYATTRGRRKAFYDAELPPEGDGWELDPDRGRPGESWERFDYHEERYWRRPARPSAPTD